METNFGGVSAPDMGRLLALSIPIIAIVGGLLVGGIAIIAGTVRSISKTKHREETKRELAAYVAEGTMKPEDAERIISADMPAWEKGKKGGFW